MFVQVLERKVGIPITMSAVYEAIARRLGITLLPVSLRIFKLRLCIWTSVVCTVLKWVPVQWSMPDYYKDAVYQDRVYM